MLKLLLTIARLNYALNLGNASEEYCLRHFPDYAKEAITVRHKLQDYHVSVWEKLGIDIKNFTMKRTILWDKDLSDDADMFLTAFQQFDIKPIRYSLNKHDLFKQDVRIIARNQKLYYLPKSSSNEEKIHKSII